MLKRKLKFPTNKSSKCKRAKKIDDQTRRNEIRIFFYSCPYSPLTHAWHSFLIIREVNEKKAKQLNKHESHFCWSLHWGDMLFSHCTFWLVYRMNRKTYLQHNCMNLLFGCSSKQQEYTTNNNKNTNLEHFFRSLALFHWSCYEIVEHFLAMPKNGVIYQLDNKQGKYKPI